jgi:putative heme-binding domain-containing protein
VAEILVSNWPGSSPTLRIGILSTLLTRQEWIQVLLSAVEQGRIPASQLNPSDQQKLLGHESKSIRDRAETFLGTVDPDREKIVASYRQVTGLKGDPQHGNTLFQQNCALCHEPHDGHPQPGPDLGGLADKSAETLLIAIFDPNRAVEARYVNYTAVTRDDREFSGVLAAETANSITLRSTTGEETLLRGDIRQLTSSGLSLMPTGFEKILTPQDAADVIACINSKAAAKP